MTTATDKAARILAVCIEEAAAKCAALATARGVAVTPAEVLAAVEADPAGDAAKSFQTLFLSALAGAKQAVSA